MATPDPSLFEEPPIHRAARLGNLAELERLRAEGADLNSRADLDTKSGSLLRQVTPLMVAALSTEGAGAETLAWLLDHGADLHAVSAAGVTAAWYAAGKGGRWEWHPWTLTPEHAPRLRLLLDAGLDPNESSCTGRTLLCEACAAGDAEAVALLLERGASCEPTPGWIDEGNDFRTEPNREPAPLPEGQFDPDQIPLFSAVKSGALECVELLLARGARLDRIEGRYDKDLLDVALSQESYAWPPLRGPDDRYFQIARRLLEVGVPLERPDQYGNTRLWRIAFRSQEGGTAFLLERGASQEPHKTTLYATRNQTPLHSICWHGSSTPEQEAVWQRIIRLLVAAGLPLEGDPSPLFVAIYGDVPCPASVRTLLELGADPNAQDQEGKTPLFYAVAERCSECVKHLLAFGADPQRADARGRTPLDLAREMFSNTEDHYYRQRSQAVLTALDHLP